MSVSLNEVLTAAGFDVAKNVKDAEWLLAQVNNFDELVEIAEQTLDDHDEYANYVEEYEEEHDDEPMDFETWKKER